MFQHNVFTILTSRTSIFLNDILLYGPVFWHRIYVALFSPVTFPPYAIKRSVEHVFGFKLRKS